MGSGYDSNHNHNHYDYRSQAIGVRMPDYVEVPIGALLRELVHLSKEQVRLQQENNTLTLAQLNETRHIDTRVREIEQDVDRILDILAPQVVDFSLTQL